MTSLTGIISNFYYLSSSFLIPRNNLVEYFVQLQTLSVHLSFNIELNFFLPLEVQYGETMLWFNMIIYDQFEFC